MKKDNLILAADRDLVWEIQSIRRNGKNAKLNGQKLSASKVSRKAQIDVYSYATADSTGYNDWVYSEENGLCAQGSMDIAIHTGKIKNSRDVWNYANTAQERSEWHNIQRHRKVGYRRFEKAMSEDRDSIRKWDFVILPDGTRAINAWVCDKHIQYTINNGRIDCSARPGTILFCEGFVK